MRFISSTKCQKYPRFQPPLLSRNFDPLNLKPCQNPKISPPVSHTLSLPVWKMHKLSRRSVSALLRTGCASSRTSAPSPLPAFQDSVIHPKTLKTLSYLIFEEKWFCSSKIHVKLLEEPLATSFNGKKKNKLEKVSL